MVAFSLTFLLLILGLGLAVAGMNGLGLVWYGMVVVFVGPFEIRTSFFLEGSFLSIRWGPIVFEVKGGVPRVQSSPFSRFDRFVDFDSLS